MARETNKEAPKVESSHVSQTRHDIEDFLNNIPCFFFNERDFQMHLAINLQGKPYDDVDVEYHIPKRFKNGLEEDYPWSTNTLSIDVMVRKGEEFIPIELKYKLKGIIGGIHRFGELSNKSIPIVTDQSAQDLGRYDFWKDVKRIELLKKHFPSVRGGFAVFLTNDPSYMRKPSKEINYYAFRMNDDDIIGGELKWKEGCGTAKGHKDFSLDGQYSLIWHSITAKGTKTGLNDDIQLWYCIAEI